MVIEPTVILHNCNTNIQVQEIDLTYHQVFTHVVESIVRSINSLTYYYNDVAELKDVLGFAIENESSKISIDKRIHRYIIRLKETIDNSPISSVLFSKLVELDFENYTLDILVIVPSHTKSSCNFFRE